MTGLQIMQIAGAAILVALVVALFAMTVRADGLRVAAVAFGLAVLVSTAWLVGALLLVGGAP